MSFGRSQVRREGSFFSREDPAHRIRDGRFTYEDFLHLLGKVSQSVRNNPHFWPIFSALPRFAWQLEMLWTSQGEHVEPVNALRTPLLSTPAAPQPTCAPDPREEAGPPDHSLQEQAGGRHVAAAVKVVV